MMYLVMSPLMLQCFHVQLGACDNMLLYFMLSTQPCILVGTHPHVHPSIHYLEMHDDLIFSTQPTLSP